MQDTRLRYAIKFVADMEKAVKFYHDVLGLEVKFESPGWSEFVTGETTLALHPSSDRNSAGKVELGFTVPDVEASYRDMTAKGVLFSMPPKKQDFGGVLAQFVVRLDFREIQQCCICENWGWQYCGDNAKQEKTAGGMHGEVA